MQKPALSIRLTGAVFATAITASMLVAAHEATYAGAAGLPIVRLERVVVRPEATQLIAAVPRQQERITAAHRD